MPLVSQVSAGDSHTCAITDTNALRCWGLNDYGQATVPSDPLGPSATYAISGRVTTSAGAGIARVTVATNTGLNTTTAADGAFTFADVASGTYTLTASKSGYTFSGRLNVVVTSANLSGKDFVGIPVATPPSPPPTKPSQSLTVGGVTVYAESFSGSMGNSTASGTIWLGDYVILTDATLNFNVGMISGSGSGLVSLITAADGSAITPIFRASFDIDTISGILTPSRLLNSDWRLNQLAGFQIDTPTNISVNSATGVLLTSVQMNVVIPGSAQWGAVDARLDHTGIISGTLHSIELQLGAVTLSINSATLTGDGTLTVNEATYRLPEGLGGNQAALEIDRIAVHSNEKIELRGGTIRFPNISVGGKEGFKIEGAAVGLRVEGETYFFQGRGTFVLPGVGSGDGGCQIGTGFTFVSAPPPVREATLSLDGCIQIPIAQTGFFITKVNGMVTLDEKNTSVTLALGIEGGSDIPGLGPTLSGEPSATWDTSWKAALSGKLRIFTFDVAQSVLALSAARGLEGTISISLAGIVDGQSSLRIWKDVSNFSIAGKAQVQVIIDKGKIIHTCAFDGCFNFPADRTVLPQQSADFGTFRRGTEIIYGLRGALDLLGMNTTFLIDAQGNLQFGDNLRDLQLVGLAAQQSSSLQAIARSQLTVPAGTPILLVGLGFTETAPLLRLRMPDGTVLTPSSSGVVTETTATQVTMVVPSPAAGSWTVEVEGSGGHVLVARGTTPLATLATPTVTSTGDGAFNIGLVASTATPTATLSLFADTSAGTRIGAQIVAGLPVTTTSYLWRAVGVPSGTYHLYAVLDDPLGLPLSADAIQTVTISDTTAPAPPSQVVTVAHDGTLDVRWAGSTSADVAGYRLYYREPGGGAEYISNIVDSTQRSYLQRGVFLPGNWEVTLSAYDRSGNENTRSDPLTVPMVLSNRFDVYLPLIQR